MDAERLFIQRCERTGELAQSQKEIDMLDLAANLRQLLVDDYPLVHQANAENRLKLTFRVGEFRNQPDQYTAILALEDGLDPDTRPPGSPSREVNFNGFMNHRILFLKGKGHSVQDVIQMAANVAGGVHRTDNPSDKQKLIADYSRSVSIGGLPGAIRQLQAIARVALKGLSPLIAAIETK
jgi:hypothetical protein